jgi:hypothetical protein
MPVPREPFERKEGEGGVYFVRRADGGGLERKEEGQEKVETEQEKKKVSKRTG